MAESQAQASIPSNCDSQKGYNSLEHKAQSKATIRHEAGPRRTKKYEHKCKGRKAGTWCKKKIAIILTLIAHQALFQAVYK